MKISKYCSIVSALLVCLSAKAADPYAKAVVSSVILNGNSGNNYTDPTRALGAPDELEVSLGGPGASLIVDMGADTPIVDEQGPDLEVRELGATVGGQDESYNVLVSNSTDTNTFQFVGVGRALSLIDISPSGLSTARYVWLQDLATETLNSVSPGSDIDSLRVLHFTGGSEDVPTPDGLSIRLTGQGVWVSWNPVTETNVTSYRIRRSLDGISFSSTADATVTAQETAWHDTNVPAVSNLFYAVSAVSDSLESGLGVISVSASSLTLLTNNVVHLGDDTVADWETPDPASTVAMIVNLPGGAVGPFAELSFDLWDVDNSANAILVNGGKVGSAPTQTSEAWAAKTLRFSAGALVPGYNTILLTARTSSGAINGSLDDFQVRNVSLQFFEPQTNSIITSTRFTEINPGQTNLTLKWVVEQTPTLSPPAWEVVSDPIEWTGTITSSNGFYRLHEQP